MTIYTTYMLLKKVNAEITDLNKNVASMIIRAYMTSKNLYEEDMVNLMREFIETGMLNFKDYNLIF